MYCVELHCPVSGNDYRGIVDDNVCSQTSLTSMHPDLTIPNVYSGTRGASSTDVTFHPCSGPIYWDTINCRHNPNYYPGSGDPYGSTLLFAEAANCR